MGSEIDRLEVQVETQAIKTNNQLDILVRKLDRVSASLSGVNSRGLATMGAGVNKLANAMNNFANNTKTTDFSRLSRNLSALGNIDVSTFSKVAGGITQLTTAINSIGNISDNALQVSEFTKSISKLGNKSVQSAITNLPALATAMNNLMTTLSRAPQVSDNIIKMTAALAGLAAQGSKVGTVSKSLTNAVNKVGNTMSANTKKVRGFASVIGSLYQKFFWVSRGIDKLWDSIESSMGYVETLNYFDAAFGQVAENAVSQWRDAGYDSADAYYESFSSRAKELTSKMTGFNINDDGTLSATGEANLGINPSKLMNYQATFAQMSSSMGVASETSLKLSQALTEIGADLASVKNMDFDKVWNDMASGLAGMSRTLDKYGVNIRNVNLQQKLFDLGINENITNLNQNDKALLRAIILLDSTKYAWGDLADTLNQPANQMRLLESNISNLSRTLGNLFLPVLSKVLPYVNGFVIAIQRLLTWVGNLMGIDLSEVIPSIGSSEVDMSELLGETDDLTGNLDDASASAKKLKSNLLGIDELNVISPQDGSSATGTGAGLSSGLLDEAFEKAFSEYQKVWDEAFANMENRANDFADKVERYLEPVKKLFEDISIGDWFAVGDDVSGIISGILQALTVEIENLGNSDVFEDIGQSIVDFICGIDWLGLTWDFGLLIDAITDALGRSSGDLVGGLLEGVVDNLLRKPLAELGIDIKIPDLSWLSDLGEITWSISFPNIGTLFSFLKDPEAEIEKFSSIFEGIKESAEAAFGNIQEIWGSLSSWVEINVITPVVGFFKGLWENVSGFFVNLWNDIVTVWSTVSTWFSEYVIEPVFSFFVGFYTRVHQIFEGLWIIVQAIWIKVSGWFNDKVITPVVSFFQGLWESVSSFFSQLWEDIKSIWGTVTEWFNTTIIVPVTDFFEGVWINVKAFFSNLWEDIKSIWASVTSWFSDTIINPVQKAFEDACNAISGFFDGLWDSIKSGVCGAMNAVIGGIESAINFIVGGVNDIISGFNKVVSWAAEVAGEDWGGVDLVPTVSLPRISWYETGGFLPSRFSLVGAGENGIPEILGSVGGKPAIAGGEEITGIREEIRATANEEMALLREQNSLLMRLLEKELSVNIGDRDIYRANLRGAKSAGYRLITES